jgi:choline dehydrogenase-like flavoprotein
MQIPAFTPFFQRSAADWAFRSQPQHNSARALNDRVSAWPRGRVLGGSSVLNYMQYVRGHADDFDSWRLPGWRFSDLLPFSFKAEAQHLGGRPSQEGRLPRPRREAGTVPLGKETRGGRRQEKGLAQQARPPGMQRGGESSRRQKQMEE